jgi:CheY-like chemotaxis protein
VLPDSLNVPVEHPNGSIVRVEVIDTGPGLSEENQRKLFHETIQFNAADMQAGNGSGFGLYSESLLPPFSCVLSLSHCRSLVSKTIIDHHEGRIGVSSELGKGSTFYFELKLHPSSQTATPAGLRAVTCPERISNVILESPSQQSLNDISSNFFLSHRLSRVLVVDDSKLNRKMLSRRLKEHFLEIVEVELISCLFFGLP